MNKNSISAIDLSNQMKSKKQIFKKMFDEMIRDLILEEVSRHQPGALNYLLYGDSPSRQSLNIKLGNRFETLLNEFSKKIGYTISEFAFDLIEGHQVDSLFDLEQSLDYDEQKMNVALDSEKKVATVDKIKEVITSLQNLTNKTVNGSIFHTTVWEENDAPNMKGYYQWYRKNGVNVKFMSDYFRVRGVEISKDEFYQMWRDAGKLLSTL